MLDRTNLKKLSDDIRAARKASGMSQSLLASKLGVSVRRVNSWESFGKKNHQVPPAVMVRAMNEIFERSGKSIQDSRVISSRWVPTVKFKERALAVIKRLFSWR